MATANDLFRTAGYNEPHIIIDGERFVNVPKELKYLGVQFDHNIETVVFDCPRYWDGHDLNELDIYINYTDVRGNLGAHHCTDVEVSDKDENIITFSWTILQNLTMLSGKIAFLVCAQKPTGDGTVEQCWHSRLCSECEILPGLECAHGMNEGDTLIPDNYDMSNAIFAHQTDEEITYSIMSHLKTSTGPVVYPITKARAVETDTGEILENILVRLTNDLANVTATANSAATAVVTAKDVADRALAIGTSAESKATDAINKANKAQDTADDAQTTADEAVKDAATAKSRADEAYTKANNAMPKIGGTFTGNVYAYSTSRQNACLRNIEVRTGSETGALVSTNKIVMVRKGSS